jgi:hypothetical protein
MTSVQYVDPECASECGQRRFWCAEQLKGGLNAITQGKFKAIHCLYASHINLGNASSTAFTHTNTHTHTHSHTVFQNGCRDVEFLYCRWLRCCPLCFGRLISFDVTPVRYPRKGTRSLWAGLTCDGTPTVWNLSCHIFLYSFQQNSTTETWEFAVRYCIAVT